MTHSNPEHDSIEMVNARIDEDYESFLTDEEEKWEEIENDDSHDDEDEEEEEDDDRFADGDALASAGWGTDEDYGCFDSGDDF